VTVDQQVQLVTLAQLVVKDLQGPKDRQDQQDQSVLQAQPDLVDSLDQQVHLDRQAQQAQVLLAQQAHKDRLDHQADQLVQRDLQEVLELQALLALVVRLALKVQLVRLVPLLQFLVQRDQRDRKVFQSDLEDQLQIQQRYLQVVTL
jgi:hypothetical protein